jgi:hypothetical protein
MHTKLYQRALILFFAFTAAVWIPWGLYCLFVPEAWSGAVIPGMEVFSLDTATARTEVRAMYGGLQIAIGLIALIAVFKKEHRPTTLLFLTLALSGLALSRMYGLLIDGNGPVFNFSMTVTPENYNAIGLSMYEFPSMLYAWILCITRFIPASAFSRQ